MLHAELIIGLKKAEQDFWYDGILVAPYKVPVNNGCL